MNVIRNILKIIENRNMNLSIWIHGGGGGNKNNDNNDNINNINIIIILITLCRVFTIVCMKGTGFYGI